MRIKHGLKTTQNEVLSADVIFVVQIALVSTDKEFIVLKTKDNHVVYV